MREDGVLVAPLSEPATVLLQSKRVKDYSVWDISGKYSLSLDPRSDPIYPYRGFITVTTATVEIGEKGSVTLSHAAIQMTSTVPEWPRTTALQACSRCDSGQQPFFLVGCIGREVRRVEAQKKQITVTVEDGESVSMMTVFGNQGQTDSGAAWVLMEEGRPGLGVAVVGLIRQNGTDCFLKPLALALFEGDTIQPQKIPSLEPFQEAMLQAPGHIDITAVVQASLNITLSEYMGCPVCRCGLREEDSVCTRHPSAGREALERVNVRVTDSSGVSLDAVTFDSALIERFKEHGPVTTPVLVTLRGSIRYNGKQSITVTDVNFTS